MKLTIVAATGGIGRHLLEQAVAAGHNVTAVVRDPTKLAADIRAVTADLASADEETLASTLHGADAVLSGLGAPSTAEVGITSRGTRAIVSAMAAADVRRLVVVSAAPVATVPSPGRPHPPKHDPGDGFFHRNLLTPLVKTTLRTTYEDLALMEDILHDSDLDWTAVRPPYLTDKPPTSSYRTAVGQNLRHGLSISRADVAHLMLHVLDQPETIQQTVGIAT